MALSLKQKIYAINTALTSNKTLNEVLSDTSSGGMGGITGGKAETIEITDDDLSMMFRNQGFLSALQKKASSTRVKVSEKDQKKYNDLFSLRKAARSVVSSLKNVVKHKNFIALAKVLDSQKPKRIKK